MRLRPWWLMLSVLIFNQGLSLAQDTCSALVQQALSTVGDHCQNLERNSACYGFQQVGANFVEQVAEDFFVQPADRSPIDLMHSVETSALDPQTATWGVAVLSLQANVPRTLPGQAVTFLLMGDAELENAADPARPAPEASSVVTLSLSVGANIRSGAGLNYNVIGTASANTSFDADARSADGEWYRIAYNQRSAWLNRAVVRETPELQTLPVPDTSSRSPMQAVYLRTGVGRTNCEQAPENVLVVQGPKNVKVNLTVNGAEVELGSTLVIRNSAEDVLEISVLDGSAQVSAQGKTVFVRAGQQTDICLSDVQNLGADGVQNDRLADCAPSPARAIPVGQRFWDGYCHLQNIPATLLNYGIDIVCPNDPAPYFDALQAQRNAERDEDDADDQPPASVGACETFSLSTPTSTVRYADSLFAWSGVSEATSYRLNFYNADTGNYVRTVDAGNVTAYSLNAGETLGSSFIWDVHAYQNEQFLCATPRSAKITTLDRYADSPPASSLAASWACSSWGGVVVSWTGARPSDNISFIYDDGGDEVSEPLGSGTSGSGTFSLCPPPNPASVSTSSGDQVALPILNCSCPIP